MSGRGIRIRKAWPDELEGEELRGQDPTPAMDDAAALSAREAAVESLLRSKRVGDALRDSLADPPDAASKDLELKSKNTVIVLKVIAAVEDRQIDEVLRSAEPRCLRRVDEIHLQGTRESRAELAAAEMAREAARQGRAGEHRAGHGGPKDRVRIE